MTLSETGIILFKLRISIVKAVPCSSFLFGSGILIKSTLDLLLNLSFLGEVKGIQYFFVSITITNPKNGRAAFPVCGETDITLSDYKFTAIYNYPERSLNKFAQYRFLLTPDYSTYADMNYWRQLESIAHSRWVGAFWQSCGLLVVPTISWSDANSFSFCFDGVERGSIVSVGMIGCKHAKDNFLRGYNAMLEKIEPSAIIVFGSPFPEMDGNIIPVDYRSSRKVVR